MAALPYMQLYVADYLADTAHLTTEQHGAYLLLLMNYWQRGKALVNSNERLSNVARMNIERWNENRDVLAEFFEVTPEEWIHKRVERDLEAVRNKSDKARASVNVRRNGRRTDVPSNVGTNVERPIYHTDTEQIQIKKQNKKDSIESFPADDVDHTLAARMLCEWIDDHDVHHERAYSDMIKAAVALGSDARDRAKLMADRWAEYQKANADGKLSWANGSAYKFFTSGGTWDKPELWPWEKGKRPQTKAKKYAEMPGREA